MTMLRSSVIGAAVVAAALGCTAAIGQVQNTSPNQGHGPVVPPPATPTQEGTFHGHGLGLPPPPAPPAHKITITFVNNAPVAALGVVNIPGGGGSEIHVSEWINQTISYTTNALATVYFKQWHTKDNSWTYPSSCVINPHGDTTITMTGYEDNVKCTTS